MNIAVSDLPDHGHDCAIGSVNIYPMTFSQIKKYNDELGNTYTQKLARDIKILESDIGPTIDELSFYNFDCLVFIKKSFSVAETNKLTIPFNCTCGTSTNIIVDTDKLVYTPFEEVIKKIMGFKISNNNAEKTYHIRYPKIKDVKKVLESVLKYKEDISKELFLLYCCITEFETIPNEVKKDVENSVREDIITLNYISSIFDGSYKQIEVTCKTCNKRSVITINNQMTDIFRLLKLNIKLNPDKIILSKNV